MLFFFNNVWLADISSSTHDTNQTKDLRTLLKAPSNFNCATFWSNADLCQEWWNHCNHVVCLLTRSSVWWHNVLFLNKRKHIVNRQDYILLEHHHEYIHIHVALKCFIRSTFCQVYGLFSFLHDENKTDWQAVSKKSVSIVLVIVLIPVISW